MTHTSWDNYRKRRAVLIGLFLSYIPSAILIATVASRMNLSIQLVVPFAIVWLVAFLLAAHWIAYFPCPHCGLTFFYQRWRYAPWSQACLHCSTEKWTESNATDNSVMHPSDHGDKQPNA